MVRLFRGAGVRGRGMPPRIAHVRPMMPRHIRPHDFESDFIPPYTAPRGRLLRGHPVRPGPPRPPMPPPHRMAPLPPPLPPRHPPLPPRLQRHPPLPPHPLHPRDMPIPITRIPHPMRPIPGRRPGMPPPMGHMHPGPPLRPHLIRGRGRGGLIRRGVAVKRLGNIDSRAKKQLKRSGKTKTPDEFYCETCDRGWSTKEKLDEHVAQHEVCGRDGCTFTGHPKIVLKHVQIQHDTGLYNRIVFTQNPDDLAKWIAERKSRFPTKENMQKKEAQNDEMMKRGERIPREGKRFQNKGGSGGWGGKRQRKNEIHKKPEAVLRRDQPQQQNLPTKLEDIKWKDPDAWRGNLPQFPGTAAFSCLEDANEKTCTEEAQFSDDEESEWLASKSENKKIEKPLVSNVLSLLMANYGSDMSDDDDEHAVPQKTEAVPPVKSEDKSIAVPIQKFEENLVLANNNVLKEELVLATGKEEEDSDSGPEECGINHEDKSNTPLIITEKKSEPKTDKVKTVNASKPTEPRQKAPMTRQYFKRHQLSLLEKLLANEIRNERNVILQCVRYVVKNNFLGCGHAEN